MQQRGERMNGDAPTALPIEFDQIVRQRAARDHVHHHKRTITSAPSGGKREFFHEAIVEVLAVGQFDIRDHVQQAMSTVAL